ncbi:MAG: zinc-ribbon domain-containing protein [Planctomycetota bacterium]
MIITCPACKAQAELPDSKEGAKVRCGECGRVYKAVRGTGRRSSTGQSQDMTKYFIIGGAVLVLLVLFIVVKNSGGTPPPPVTTDASEKAPAEVAEATGWDSPAVKVVREIYDLANTGNKLMLRTKVWGQGYLDRKNAAAGLPASRFDTLPADQQAALLDEAADSLVDPEILAGWKAIDGECVPPQSWTELIPEKGNMVRVEIGPVDANDTRGARHSEWFLARVGSSYKVYGWQRWISDAEKEAEKKARIGKTTQTTLTDGSKVVEGNIREVPWMDETTQEERAHIESLIDQMIDPDGTKSFRIKKELSAIGKPAIPALLNRIYRMPYQEGQVAEQLNLIHRALMDITGHQTTYNLDLFGATVERQQSGLKQWFGWYDRKFKKFTVRPEVEETE